MARRHGAPKRPGPVLPEFQEPEETSTAESVLRTAQSGGDVFNGFCRAVVDVLRSQKGVLVPLNKVAQAPLVQAEWAALQQIRAIGKNTKMKQVLLERSHLFEVQLDSKFQPHVRLISSGVDLSAWSHLSAVCAASAAIAGLANRAAESPPAPLTTLPVEAPETAALGPELLSALEMHLTRRNGHERYSVLRSKFGVKQAQLRPYFQVLPAGHDAVVALCHEPGGAMPKVPGPMNSSVQEAVEGLTLLLGELNTRRCSIGRAMAFCMDRAESHAALLSRRMCSALSEPLPSVEALARFYLVNDVLHNAASEKPGAQQFRESFQDLLPEACEGFGRQWLRRLELPLREPMERRVRSVLHGWETWSIFPRLYIKGLEALLFSPVTTRLDTGCEDAALERKLQRWRLPGDPTQLPCAARRRGLAGKAQKAEVLQLVVARCVVQGCVTLSGIGIDRALRSQIPSPKRPRPFFAARQGHWPSRSALARCVVIFEGMRSPCASAGMSPRTLGTCDGRMVACSWPALSSSSR
ncbi:U2 snRNP-associated SURP motif-containing protein (140 kDa Ser/Arg-rich domain protein) (U2-associated protein SR140) [Durusdinium trenchii]|uniref:U2 snRNP-associated SURP motif-containing protein (140 kDa Ser/Arg-rich domain protein) (U2-associated protein SR140) n=1 Tax=Durusdinium trenchii TaxID=1381693 RepID=A0ABP0L9F9_9DINO